jgi:Skp family chaperone for outer membrane proteins
MHNDRFWRLGCAALAGLALLMAMRPDGATAQSGRTIPVATVNLETVINGLEERSQRQSQLEDFILKEEAKLQALGQQVADARAALEAMNPGSPAYRTQNEEVVRLTLQAQLQKEFSEQLVASRRAKVFKDLFEKVNETTRRLAERRGYDVVISTDETAQLPDGTEGQVRGAIVQRRVLYSAPAVDISAELLQLMNNEFAAGGGG